MRELSNKIRQQIKPSSIIGRTVALKQKSADQFLGLCPFHSEKTPSFTITDSKGFYHCFGCGAHGTIIDFIINIEGHTYKQAIELLAKEIGLELPKLTPKLKQQLTEEASILKLLNICSEYFQTKLFEFPAQIALNYAKDRGLNNETIATYKLGYAPNKMGELVNILLRDFSEDLLIKSSVFMRSLSGDLFSMFHGRLIFPIQNEYGDVIGFGGRTLDGNEPKYLNSSDSPVFKKGNELYGLNIAKKSAFKQKEVIVVEGYMDVITMAQAGIENVVAPLGTAFKKTQLLKLWQVVDEPTLLFDNDAAGQKAMLLAAEIALTAIQPGKTVKFANLMDAKDPDEAILKFGKEHLLSIIKNAETLSDFVYRTKAKNINWQVPERVAAFKQDLIKLSDKIADKDISYIYRNKLIDSFNNEFSSIRQSRRKYVKNKHSYDVAAQNVTNLKVANRPISLSLLYVLIRYPQLLQDNEILDDLVKLEFNSKNLDKFRAIILNYISYKKHEDGSQILLSIQHQIEAMREFSLLKEDIGLRPFLDASKSLLEARAYAIRLFDLSLLDRMEEQYKQINAKLLQNPSQELFTKLRYLSENIKQLRNKIGFA